MNSITFIRTTLDAGHAWIKGLLVGMEGNELTRPTLEGGNHVVWVVGHLLYSEARVIHKYLLKQENPFEKYAPLFGVGSQPAADAAGYPRLAELLAEWQTIRKRTLELLASYQETDLDRPTPAPAELESMLGTIGRCFVLLCNHQMFHAGQIADCRRAAGLKPVFA